MDYNEKRFLLPRWLLFIVWGALIVWLSLIPSPPVINAPFLGWDKLQHGAAYALLTLLCFLAMPGPMPDLRRHAGAVTFLAILLGALMEAAQWLFTTTRKAEAGDLLADAIGALLVYGAVTWRQRMKRSLKTVRGGFNAYGSHL
ncbi:MAG: VanZ family protein [Geobacteraceae bacterium]